MSLPPASARRWGWRLTGRKPTRTLGDEHSREHRQTPRPGTGRGPGYLVSGSRGAASPQQPRAQSGRREAEREPGSRASGQLFTHSPHPERSSQSGMGGGGSLAGSCADAGRGCEPRDWRLRDASPGAAAALPLRPSPLCHLSCSSAVRGLRAPRAGAPALLPASRGTSVGWGAPGAAPSGARGNTPLSQPRKLRHTV